MSPVHYLPTSVLAKSILSVPVVLDDGKADEDEADSIAIESNKARFKSLNEDGDSQEESYLPPRKAENSKPDSEYSPPKDEYGPPKSDPAPPNDEYGPPNDEYGPPNSDPAPPKSEYDPPESESDPSPQPQQTLIYKSYIEPTYSFGEVPLLRYLDTESSAERPKTKEAKSKGGY